MAQRSDLTVRRLAGALWPLVVLAFLVNATVVVVALQAVNVPGDNEMLDFPVLLFASIGPVIGNGVGFLAAYRRPTRASLIGFLLPGILITAGFLALTVSDFADHDDVGVLATGILVTVLPTIVAVIGLLRRRAALLHARTAAPEAPRVTPVGRSATGEWDLAALVAPAWGGPAPPTASSDPGPVDPGPVDPGPVDPGATATWDRESLERAAPGPSVSGPPPPVWGNPPIGLPPSPLEADRQSPLPPDEQPERDGQGWRRT